MGQFNFKNKTEHASTSHPEWLGVSSAIGRMANTWSGRYDIAAFAGPDAAEGHPAFFNPLTSEVEVNVEKCFGTGVTPSDIGSLDLRDTQYEFPRATGAVFHEAMHARYSRWDLSKSQGDLKPAEFRALVGLEEGRIERQGLEIFPSNAAFLRSCAVEIILADLDNVAADSDTVMAADIAVLTLARVDAGSLEEEDVAELRGALAEKLGADRLEKMREIWVKAQDYRVHDNAAGMYDLAREWVSLVDEAAEENGDAKSDEAGTPSDGVGGVPSEFAKIIAKALAESADSASIGAFNDLADVQMSEEWAEAVKDMATKSKVTKDAVDAAKDVFGTGTTEMKDKNPTASTLVEERAPEGKERAAAVKLAQLLEKAKYRDRDATEVSSILPPGRLRTRAAVQGAALKSKGIMTQVEPWRQTKRKQVDDPTLSIGVMVDISGSMGAAMQPMASIAWVLSEATRRVQGRAAMVYYGNNVFPTLKPGQHLDRVKVYSAPDMTEKFDKAFKALNGGLNLLNGSGARLLVVVSDGEYTDHEKTAARHWLTACERDGVGVLWLSFPNRYSGRLVAQEIVAGHKAVLQIITDDLTVSATAIGSAAVRALSAAN